MRLQLVVSFSALWLASGCGLEFIDPPAPELDRVGPARIDDLRLTQRAGRSLLVAWTAPGDDGVSGTPARIELRFAEKADGETLDGASFGEAQELSPAVQPRAGGSHQEVEVGPLEPDRRYCLAARAIDDAGNLAPLSDVLCARTLDSEPPPTVTDLTVSGDERGRRLVLQWVMPEAADLVGAVVLRAEGAAAPELPRDGSSLLVGDRVGGALVAAVLEGSATRFEDGDLIDGQRYTYAVHAMDDDWLYGPPAVGGGVPGDERAPLALASPRIANLRDGSLGLSWELPVDEQPLRTLVLRRAGQAPVWAPTHGEELTVGATVSAGGDGEAGETRVVYVGARADFTDVGLRNDHMYHYALYPFDPALNYGPVAELAEQPTSSDGEPPELFDLQIVPSAATGGQLVELSFTSTEPLQPDPSPTLLVRRGSGEESGQCGGAGLSWLCTYLVPEQGEGEEVCDLQVTANDLNGNEVVVPILDGLRLDFVPPTQATGLSVTPDSQGRRLDVAWTAPADLDLARVLVTRNGVSVLDGPSGEPGGSAELHLDGLIDGESYEVVVVYEDEVGQASPPATLSERPRDATPPGRLLALTVGDAVDQRVELSWELPQDEEPLSVVVLRRAEAPPDQDPVDGTLYLLGDVVAEAEVVYAGRSAGFTDRTPADRVAFHYAAYARDLAHNHSPAQRVTATPLPSDDVAPGFVDVRVQPLVAGPRARVTVTFATSEPLSEAPTVTLAGQHAACEHTGLDHHCALTLSPDAETGTWPVLLSGVDVAGNPGEATGPSVRFDFDDPQVGDLRAVAPVVGRQVAELSFTTSEPLVELPSVTVNGNPATVFRIEPQQFTARYQPRGAEPEGAATVVVSGADEAGNPLEEISQEVLAFDFTPPTFEVLEVDPAQVGLAQVRTPVRIRVTADEALAAAPVVTVGGPLNEATFLPDEALEPERLYEYTPLGSEDGVITVTGQDTYGNEGQAVVLAEFDFQPPGKPQLLFVDFHQNPEGSADTIRGRAGAIFGGATDVWLYRRLPFDEDTLLRGPVPVGEDGGFDEIDLGDNEEPVFYLVARDGVGNTSEPLGPLYNDIEAPEVSLDPGNPEESFHGEHPAFRVFVQDDSSTDVTLTVAGSEAQQVAQDGGQHLFLFEVQQGRDGVGAKEVVARATDPAGNTGMATGSIGLVLFVPELPRQGPRLSVTHALQSGDVALAPAAGVRASFYQIGLEQHEELSVVVQGHGLSLGLALTEHRDPLGAVVRGGALDAVGPGSARLTFTAPRTAQYPLDADRSNPPRSYAFLTRRPVHR